MNKFEVFNNCKERINNQLRIHWSWLRRKEDYKEVFEFIEAWMNQAIKVDDIEETNNKNSGWGLSYGSPKTGNNSQNSDFTREIVSPKQKKGCGKYIFGSFGGQDCGNITEFHGQVFCEECENYYATQGKGECLE